MLPCSTANVGIVGPCKVLFNTTDGTKIKKYNSALDIVYSDTSWPEIIYIKYKSSANISRIFEDNLLCYYQSPARLVHDNGTKFTG